MIGDVSNIDEDEKDQGHEEEESGEEAEYLAALGCSFDICSRMFLLRSYVGGGWL